MIGFILEHKFYILTHLLVGMGLAEGARRTQGKSGEEFSAFAYATVTLTWPLVIAGLALRGIYYGMFPQKTQEG